MRESCFLKDVGAKHIYTVPTHTSVLVLEAVIKGKQLKVMEEILMKYCYLFACCSSTTYSPRPSSLTISSFPPPLLVHPAISLSSSHIPFLPAEDSPRGSLQCCCSRKGRHTSEGLLCVGPDSPPMALASSLLNKWPTSTPAVQIEHACRTYSSIINKHINN